MRHRPVTPAIGAALAAVGAVALIGFALLAQVTAPDLFTTPPRAPVGSQHGGPSSNAIVLPSPTPNSAPDQGGGGVAAGGAAVVPITPVVAFVPGAGAADQSDGSVLPADPRRATGTGSFAPDERERASADDEGSRRGAKEDGKPKDARRRGGRHAVAVSQHDGDDRSVARSVSLTSSGRSSGDVKAKGHVRGSHGGANAHRGGKSHGCGKTHRCGKSRKH